jgi:hypothetical protein
MLQIVPQSARHTFQVIIHEQPYHLAPGDVKNVTFPAILFAVSYISVFLCTLVLYGQCKPTLTAVPANTYCSSHTLGSQPTLVNPHQKSLQ